MNMTRLFFVVMLVALYCYEGFGQSNQKTKADNSGARLTTHRKDARSCYDLGMLLDKQRRKEEALANLETATKLEPQNLQYGNDYRLRCIAYKEYDRPVTFFQGLIGERDVPELHLQLALAYVDKMPAIGLGRFLDKARLSSKSIQELNKILEKDPRSWAAFYARGMNYLHWPKAFNRTPQAIEDFKKLIEIQDAQGKSSKDYFVLSYVALGDAYVKNEQFKEAREAWKKGVELFPGHPQLMQRLSMGADDRVLEFVKKERGINIQMDTDLSILWRQKKRE